MSFCLRVPISPDFADFALKGWISEGIARYSVTASTAQMVSQEGHEIEERKRGDPGPVFLIDTNGAPDNVGIDGTSGAHAA